MKKLLMATAVVAALFISGCNSAGSSDPKVVLMSFFDALAKKDISAARKYATADSKSMLDMMEMGMKASDKDSKEDKYDKSKMEFGDAKIDGDKASVPVKDKTSGETTNFTLKKESGAWKVAFDKASMMTMGADKMKESGLGNTDSISNNVDNITNNIDSLGDKVKEGLDKLDQNKDKLQEAAKKLEEAAKKMGAN